MTVAEKEALLEGFKEFLRTSLLALIPLLIASLQVAGTVDWKTLGVSAAIAILSGIDKWLHEKGVETPLDFKEMKV